jgi:hypothetical protein
VIARTESEQTRHRAHPAAHQTTRDFSGRLGLQHLQHLQPQQSTPITQYGPLSAIILPSAVSILWTGLHSECIEHAIYRRFFQAQAKIKVHPFRRARNVCIAISGLARNAIVWEWIGESGGNVSSARSWFDPTARSAARLYIMSH